VLVVTAIVLDAIAYRLRESAVARRAGGHRNSLVGGLLMGTFYPFVAKAMTERAHRAHMRRSSSSQLVWRHVPFP